MEPIDFIIIAVILTIITLVTVYIIKAKKKGQKCIGCPYGKECSKNNGNSCCGGCNSKTH